MNETFEKAGRAATAVVLAAGLCWPCGLALADGEGDGAVSVSAAAAAPDAVEADMAEPSGGGASGEAAPPEGGPAGDGLSPADPASGPSADAADPVPSSGPAAGAGDGGEKAAADGSSSSDAADKDAEKAAAANADADARADEARRALSEADAALSRASGALGDVDAACAPFEAAAAGAPEAIAAARDLRARADKAAAELPASHEAAARARIDAIASSSAGAMPAAAKAAPIGGTAQLSVASQVSPVGAQTPAPAAEGRTPQPGMTSQLGSVGASSSSPAAEGGTLQPATAASPIELDPHLAADAREAAYEAARAESEGLQASAAKAEETAEAKERELLALAEAGNSAAFDAEMALADCRKAYRAAQEAADSIPDSVEGAAAFKANVASDIASLDARRAAVQAQVAAWYELAEGAVGAQGALSFGAGVDFGLAEGEFVAKWGAAIDRFLSGRGAPLAGYGEAMAKSAYKWRIDPRLCAAVSITESSGGLYCIKPHNAWGWGAADSDPYGLAWQWGSWEEAIEAWHEGVATNTAGLATARTLTAFGEIYASSTTWAQNTATSMRQITP